MTRQHIHIHRLHPRQPNKSRSQRFTAVTCTLCTASFPPLPPKQHNFFYVAILLSLIVIFDCCFLWRNLFNPFALRLLFSPLQYSLDNACDAAFLADTPLCTISSLRPNPLLPRATSPHTSHISTFCRLYSSWQCRGAHSPALSFHVEQRHCRPPRPQRLSAFLAFYAYLCIVFYALHCFALSALSLCHNSFPPLPLASRR